jgi:putative endonuclease
VSAGAAFEAQALAYLLAHGATLIARNVRSRFGEIDLIVRDLDVTVFVEVRARTPSRFGDGIESIDARKTHKIELTARDWLKRHPQAARGPCRFDVVAIASDGSRPPLWLKRAWG